MKFGKYILSFIFSTVLFVQSFGQNIDSTENVRVYFQTVSYYFNENLASSVFVYDTYYRKIDSIVVPKEGLYINLPKRDLIFDVRIMDIRHKSKKEFLYADELKDSLTILIDTKKIDRCPTMFRDVLFKENSFELDSAALTELRLIKRQLLLMDNFSHCVVIEVYSHIDDLEKNDASELMKNRAAAVVQVLSENNAVTFKVFDKYKNWRHVENPGAAEEHARNRFVGFKIDNRNCYQQNLIIKE